MPANHHLIHTGRHLNVPTAAVIVFVAALGAIIVWTLHAAGTPVAFETETGTLKTPAKSVTSLGASGGSAVQFGTPVTPSPTPSGTPSNAKPDASTTGVPAGTALTVVNGDQTYGTAGQVISGLDIHGYVRVTAKNVTIKNSIIRGGTKPCTSSNAQNSAALWIRDDAGASATVQDVEISPSNATACMDGIWASNITLTRVNVHGSVDGIKGYDNVTVQDSYIHDLAHFASDPNQGGGETHNDGIQTYECNANISVQHNNIDLSTSTSPNAVYQITQDSGQPCSNIVINNNWLDGGGCSINIAHKTLASLTGVSITNNRFGHHQGFSNCTVLLSTQSHLTAYSGNVWADTGGAIPAPQVHD